MAPFTTVVSWAGLALSVGALAGCPSPNTYGSPRTIAPGKLQHTVALEAFTVSNDDDSVTLPNLPTYQLRVGLADSVDLGARIANLSSIGADVKWNFLKGRVDLALDPGFNTSYVSTSSGGQSSSAFILHGNVPLLVGINAADWFTIHLTPGFAGTFASSTATSNSAQDSFAQSFVGARMGLGLNFRVSDGFAVTPEATFIRAFSDRPFNWLTFGLGFSFGTMPDYQDMR